MLDSAIEIRNVCKRYRDKKVLADLTFNVMRGQTFAFLGRNGAGKSTTIQILLGLIKPDSGSVAVSGTDPAVDPLQVRRTAGYLAEDQTMYGWMTVDQLIRFIAPFYPTWDHALAASYARQFELPLQTKVRQLSKGQTVRLGLLLALTHRPEVVILDDPALGLDPLMRRDFNRDLVAHLQSEGRTVLYSSHLLYEVEPVADMVGILHEGRIVRQGPPEELRTQIQRLVMTAENVARVGTRLQILDGRVVAGEVILTVDNAEQAISMLRCEGIDHRHIRLNLDEIFEALVAGCRNIRFDLPEAEPVLQQDLNRRGIS